ncbi:DUF2029 domain-containing protein, partial [Patescibacteria group bacterium]|nr:DUF2029 domain-containing protein [Patescibacteria group bacterium]
MAIAKKRKVPSLIFKAVQLSMIGAILVYAFFLIDKDMLRRLDLVSYITGARILQSDSRDLLYNIATQQKFQAEITTSNLQLLPFRNPPFLALVFIPLAKLPIGLSYKILVLVNLFLLFVSALFLTKEFAKFNFSFVYGLSLLFWPAIIGILTGQISILLFILWIGIYKTLKSGNSALVGVLIALLFNKIQFVTIALFAFFLSKKKKEF